MHTTPYPPMLLVPLAWHNDSTGTLVRKHRFSKLGPRDSDAFFVTVFVDDESCCLSRSLTTARIFSGLLFVCNTNGDSSPLTSSIKIQFIGMLPPVIRRVVP